MTPDLETSLKLFGQLIGLLDDAGGIQWTWFGHPEAFLLGSHDASLKDSEGNPVGIANHRDFIGKLLRELLTQTPDDPDASFTDNYVWVPVNGADPNVNVGFVWSKSPATLELGIGAKAGFQVGGEQVGLAALAKIVGIDKGDVTPLFKDLRLKGTLAPPDFLSSIAIEGDTTPTKFTVTAADKTPTQMILTMPPAQSGALPWDCLRMALFLVRAWVHKNVGANTTFGTVDKHLFAFLGDPPTAQYPAFPLIGQANMGTVPSFNAWWSAVLPPTGGTAQSALAFLWRLRALITGSEDAKFLSAAVGNANAPAGSLFFPLLKAQPAGAMPTNPAQASGAYTPGGMGAVGAWMGILNNAAGNFTLVLDVQQATNGSFGRIPLAQLTGGVVSLPNLTAAPIAFLNGLSAAAKAALPFAFETVGPDLRIHLFQQNLAAAPLSGMFDVSAYVQAGKPVRFEVTLGGLPAIQLPPDAAPAKATDFLAGMIQWITAFLPTNAANPNDPQTEIFGIAKAAGDFVAAELRNPASLPVGSLLKAIATVMTAGGKSIDIIDQKPFDLSVGLDTGADTFFHVQPKITYGPIKVDEIPGLPISIGLLNGSLDFAVDGPTPLAGFSVGFDDLRIGATKGDGSGGASDLISSLIPDLKQAPGFHFELDWKAKGGVTITGGGKIPIQVTLGPLNLSQLLVEAGNTNLTIGINLGFQLSAIDVSTYELGLGFNFQSNTPTLNLNGLGLSFDGAGIKLSGLFLNNKGDYIGGAAVSIEDMFSLSAIGGYKKLKDGQASLFIFASLMAPLGGPPFFFVTGIAGGFGYNRMLPPPTLMSKHPFFKIMSGELPISSDPKQGMGDLASLDDPTVGFAPKEGDYWIAAGVQFISFGFINGKVILAVAFGHDFSIDILGIASFGLKPVAYFEIDILVSVDKEKFLLKAGVSPNSYLIHPDIFSLSGDFGLAVWHGGPHAGDFVLSVGGYHPYFKQPDYYPQLNRVAVKATVFGFVHLSVECFFACTPQALMAGASVSLSAEFAGIGAGLDVYVDVLIQWDPFFIMATMGVTVWFEFLGRHEIGVDLQIHTPPFGGVATIHLFIVSFDVSFGDDSNTKPALPVADFFTRQLGVPAQPTSLVNDANVALFNTAKKAGLVKIVFTSGKSVKDTADTEKAQEGTTTPVKLAPEFSFLVTTRLPFEDAPALSLGPDGQATLTGITHLPLCLLGDLNTTLTVNVKSGGKLVSIPAPVLTSDVTANDPRNFPLAQFGGTPLAPAQADNDSARSSVSDIDTSQPAIPMVDGLRFNLQATPSPVNPATMKGPEEELSDSLGDYPLPLGGVADTRLPKSKFSFLASAAATAATQKNVALLAPSSNAPRKAKLVSRLALPPIQAPKIVSTSAPVHRPVKAVASKGTTVAAPPAGLAAVAPPASPARRVELANVVLRTVPARTAQAAPPTRPISLVRALPLRTVLTAPVAGAAAAAVATAAPAKPSVVVTSGTAVHLAISSAKAPKGTLAFTGQQTVRAIFMTAFGEPLADRYITGPQTVPLPPRSRNVLLIGEGMLAAAPASLGNIGVEPGSSLYAIGHREFAGHGCVLRTNAPALQKIDAGDTLAGRDILPNSNSFSVYFAQAPQGAAVFIAVTPAVANPASAPSQVRWRGIGGTLTNLRTAATTDRAAFVMDVQSAGPWTLDIDLDTDWKLDSVVVCVSGADVLTQLRDSAKWKFVDDGFVAPPAPMSTTVTMEVANG
jgi:hypothetical protein